MFFPSALVVRQSAVLPQRESYLKRALASIAGDKRIAPDGLWGQGKAGLGVPEHVSGE